jgi:hypothetical protein
MITIMTDVVSNDLKLRMLYTEFHYAECHYTNCRGARINPAKEY